MAEVPAGVWPSMTGSRVCTGHVRSDERGGLQEVRLTKFICGASKPDIVKKMLSDMEQRDSFFWLEMLTGN